MIKAKLFEEEPVIMFNYFGMHKHSIEMLRLIKVKEHRKFIQYFTEEYMPDDTMIANLVILVHHVARGSALELASWESLERTSKPANQQSHCWKLR